MNSPEPFHFLSNDNSIENYGKSGNQFDIRDSNWNFIELVLHGMGMEKHSEKFQNQNISIDTFLNMNYDDLVALGIEEENDIKIFLENLSNHTKCNKSDYVISENHEDDLIIAKNIFNQMVLLHKYSAFLQLKWTKKEFIDYEGDKPHPPIKLLRLFSEAALIQCNNMINILGEGESNGDDLIEKFLQVQKVTLPKHLRQKLTKKKGNFLKMATLVGIPLAVVLTVRLMSAKGR